jgi:hypothetical protein
MSLDDLREMGIVVGHIVDSELGNKYIACVGKVTPGGVVSSTGEYHLADEPLQAAMECYEQSGLARKDRE